MADLDVLSLGMMMAEVAPPRAGTSVAESPDLVLFPSGSATIFAIALARLGARVGTLSRVGDDDLGRWMIAQANAAGIDTSGVAVVAGQMTPLALASVDAQGKKQYSFYRFPDTCDPLATLKAREVSDEMLGQARVFDVGEASLRSPELRGETLTLMDRARALGLEVCYTPNYRASSWKGGADEAVTVQRCAIGRSDIALMNAEEARLISGEDDITRAALELTSLGPQVVAVTDGARTTTLIADGAVTTLPVVQSNVLFDIGAGDTFHAGFLAAWTSGWDPVESTQFALHAAALKISRPPDPSRNPTRAEVLDALAQQARA